jgi:hypothetical protein
MPAVWRVDRYGIPKKPVRIYYRNSEESVRSIVNRIFHGFGWIFAIPNGSDGKSFRLRNGDYLTEIPFA